ncbi:MAG: L,D-transpeptidase family protein [Shewanella sp.]
MVPVTRLTLSYTLGPCRKMSQRLWWLTALLMAFILVSIELQAVEPTDRPNLAFEPDISIEELLDHTLLLDLADVSPVFSANYQKLRQWQHKHVNLDEQTELIKMRQQLVRYWHYLDQQAECVEPCISQIFTQQSSYYHAVSLTLYQLMQLEDLTSWESLILEEKLSPGQQSPLISPIARRLFVLGFLPNELRMEPSVEANNGMLYGDELVTAIKLFQQQHGLLADGVIGKQTLFWLNQSPRARAKLLARNVLRQSIFTAQLPARYLLVNIPAFELKLIEDGKVALRSKVIVGKASRPTPLLASQISSVVMNPEWRVPRTIIKRDILPHIRQDGHYLTEREFDVYAYDGQQAEHSADEWQALASSHFPYQLVQRPGPKNALGRYKFHFDNSFSVYLHGTSEPSLFKKANRALSSGCIRVEKVEELALWFKTHLVKDQRLWDKLHTDTTQSQWFALSDKLPVFVVYWTVWLDDAGQVQYRNDIYQQESELSHAVSATIFNTL